MRDDIHWRDLPGYPNHQGSIDGEIRHKKKKNILKPIHDKDGYIVMSLGNKDNVRIHIPLCEAFHGPAPEGKDQVNHINTRRDDNHASNLEWVNGSENIKWGVLNGNVDPLKASRRAADVNIKPVRIRETGEVFPSVKACGEYFRVNPNNISRVLVGNRKGQRFHGYHLEFVEKGEL